MLTVMVGRDASGKSRTRAPLARRYSVTPSTVAIFLAGSAAGNAETQSRTANKGVKRCTMHLDVGERAGKGLVECGHIGDESVSAAVGIGYGKRDEKLVRKAPPPGDRRLDNGEWFVSHPSALSLIGFSLVSILNIVYNILTCTRKRSPP